MSRTAEYIREVDQWSAHNYGPLPVVLERGEGVWVWDVDGRKYLDMLAAYSAVNQGHRHPRIIEALERQAGRLTLTSRAFHNDRMGPFLRRLCEATGFDRALPMNTGAEAVETALKAARKWGYEVKGVPADRAEIIVCENNFHGRTTTIVGFSSEHQYRQGFGPFAPGFITIPYGDTDALERAIGPDTVGFLVEPIQGEGGIVVPPDGYMKTVQEICRANRVLVLNDEIQTGLGRTGKMFCGDWDGERGDILIVGKALGGGVFPVSGILANDDVMDVFHPGDHGSTFGGNPLGAAVGEASLAVIVDEGLPDRSLELGTWLQDRLRDIESPHVAEVRGRGLMIGVEIKKESGPARPFCNALMERGILCNDTHHQVIRIAPPLVISRDELEVALDVITEVVGVGSPVGAA
ncbi:MAG: ornithine--oxo-acid transaminase [marine benthic group bacterium]|nr:ornithine--oxo-acid transaminase [Gemmatimonadota bacterium]MCL7961656.1 ornithine--oxo-acid transaminase [Candidatus Carthagonibacter metallireducens]MCL7938326.1 ornithine--oxo-acid transaminase [Gemmatimonadota bacterium]MCL7964537.1 ornithine--oxo-acid transaminase [Gemmatimonadota bacterium]MCL7967986.1 ornithine--oxo-acid transaminase [Gemmatimonadota bacterium]